MTTTHGSDLDRSMMYGNLQVRIQRGENSLPEFDLQMKTALLEKLAGPSRVWFAEYEVPPRQPRM